MFQDTNVTDPADANRLAWTMSWQRQGVAVGVDPEVDDPDRN